MSPREGFFKISSSQINSRYFTFFLAWLALAECRIFHVSYISERDMKSSATTSLGQQQALSVVHCTLICINTNGCWSTVFKGDKCLLLSKRRHRRSQHLAENRGAVMTQLDKLCSPNPCLYNGSCTETEFDFKCRCAWSRVGLRCETRVLEASCVAIRKKYPVASTFWYHIYASLEKSHYVTAYCDMETDGGGWMQVLTVELKTDHISDSPINQVNSLSKLDSMKNYVLALDALRELKELLDFKEMRLRCSAAGIFMHIKTAPNEAGKAFVKFFIANTVPDSPYSFCESFVALPDDKSGVLKNCTDISLPSDIFGSPGVVGYRNIWGAGRFGFWFVCGDSVDKTKRGYFWEVFVR